jgi:hypothetical protein
VLFLGNSKALVEEEKFRKNGKKKYEVLSERLVTLAATLHTGIHHPHSSATSSSRGGTSLISPFLVTVDAASVFSVLSSQAQSLIRNSSNGHNSRAVQERLELMHLHTTTHGTRRWSGDKDTLEREAKELDDTPGESLSNSRSKISQISIATSTQPQKPHSAILSPQASSQRIKPSGLMNSQASRVPTSGRDKLPKTPHAPSDENNFRKNLLF